MNTQTIQLTTAKGNVIQLFFNNDTGLIVVDLIAANEQGGNEFVRMTIDEDKMLAPFLPKSKKTSRLKLSAIRSLDVSCHPVAGDDMEASHSHS